MKYFTVDYSLETKIVGTQYPQVWDFIKGYKPELENNGIFSLYQDGFPMNNPDLSGLKLSNGSKYTDFMSNGFADDLFILSEGAKSLLETMNMEEHRFYQANIISLRRKTEKAYYFMKLLSETFEYVDFNRSSFIIKNQYVGDIRDTIKVNSFQDFMVKDREIRNHSKWEYCLQSTSIKMLPAFYELRLDLFKISHPIRWYVSANLFELIHKYKLTGWEFKEVDL